MAVKFHEVELASIIPALSRDRGEREARQFPEAQEPDGLAPAGRRMGWGAYLK